MNSLNSYEIYSILVRVVDAKGWVEDKRGRGKRIYVFWPPSLIFYNKLQPWL